VHGNASTIGIAWRSRMVQVALRVTDNGSGCRRGCRAGHDCGPPVAAGDAGAGGADRARAVDPECAGTGTVVEVRIPPAGG
jgi:hypothetical protein